MQTASIWEFKGYTMRSSRIEDKDAYYLAGFTECDSEVARMTGSKMHYSKEEVDAYFVNCLNDSTRYDFLIFDPQGSLIGESVINEIDEQARSANFRICIFKSKNCGKGMGDSNNKRFRLLRAKAAQTFTGCVLIQYTGQKSL